MKTKIGKFDPATGTVPVTFTSGDRSHTRAVNAVRSADGSYDAKATRERVDQVALGVAHKFELGLLAPSESA